MTCPQATLPAASSVTLLLPSQRLADGRRRYGSSGSCSRCEQLPRARKRSRARAATPWLTRLCCADQEAVGGDAPGAAPQIGAAPKDKVAARTAPFIAIGASLSAGAVRRRAAPGAAYKRCPGKWPRGVHASADTRSHSSAPAPTDFGTACCAVGALINGEPEVRKHAAATGPSHSRRDHGRRQPLSPAFKRRRRDHPSDTLRFRARAGYWRVARCAHCLLGLPRRRWRRRRVRTSDASLAAQ